MPSLDESGVHSLVRTEQVEDLMLACPKAFNQGYNRATRTIGNEFGRIFTKSQLAGGAGVKIRRMGTPKAPPSGQPRLPARMRKAGFKATLDGLARIEGKKLRISSRSPAMYTQEVGGSISSKSKLGMALSFSRAKPVARELVPTFRALRRGSKVILFLPTTDKKGKDKLKGLAHYRKSISLRPRLKFIQTWDVNVSDFLGRLDKSTEDTIKRLSKAPATASAASSALSSLAPAMASPTTISSLGGGGMDGGDGP